MKYTEVALGGTFDRFHRGHEKFLSFAFERGLRVLIGVTSHSMVAEKELTGIIQPLSERKQAVREFLRKRGLLGRAQVIELKDAAGPLLTDKDIKAIIATRITLRGAEAVNSLRKGVGWAELPIELCPLVKSDDGVHISSTRIRRGEINRQGHIYLTGLKKSVVVDEKFKKFLQRKPKILWQTTKSAEIKRLLARMNPTKVAVVGDQSTAYFRKHQIDFDYCVFDGRVRRRADRSVWTTPLPFEVETVVNSAGLISTGLTVALKRLVAKPQGGVLVKGEEDLAAPALVLLLPLNSVVVYGYPGKGLGVLQVTEELKEQVYYYCGR